MMPQKMNLLTINTFLWEGDGAISLVRSSPAVPSHQILYFFLNMISFIPDFSCSNNFKFMSLGFLQNFLREMGLT